MSNIAILGIGAMGQRMAKNLICDGHVLYLWNRTASRCATLVESGATVVDTPREAASNADIVISMLTNDEASRSVWLNEKTGALHGIHADAVAIECSTLSLDWCHTLSTRFASAGKRFLDAPVVGSRPQAEARQLIHLVGGDSNALRQVASVLNTNAAKIHYLGDSGSGMAIKLAVNSLFATQVAALGEMLGLLQRYGIDLQSAASLMSDLPITSPAQKGITAALAAGNFAPQFPIKLVEKDLGYALAAAQKCGVDIPVTETVRALYRMSAAKGYTEENIHAVAKVFGQAGDKSPEIGIADKWH